MPPVYNQGHIGSCSSNAISAAIQYQRHISNKRDIVPSRLFTYFNARRLLKTQKQDTGAMTSQVLQGIDRFGWVAENRHRYNTDKLTERPENDDYKVAVKHKVVYSKLSQSEADIESSILNGKPVIVSFLVYEGFHKLGTKTLKAPLDIDSNTGHTVLVTGFDDASKTFTFRNSYGLKWGNKGYGKVAYDYLLNPDIGYDFHRIDKA